MRIVPTNSKPLFCSVRVQNDPHVTRKKVGERKKKETKKKEKREKKEKTAVPSLRERSASCPRSAGWACTLESQEANPLPKCRLSASVRITGYRRSGWRPVKVRIECARSGPNPGSIIGEANVQNPSLQANTPPRLPAKTMFKLVI